MTSLLDADKHPASELIELYHVRLEEEIAFSEWKVALCESKVLRSQSPAMVRLEIRGLRIIHFIFHTLIFHAAERAGIAPIQISFTGALDVLYARLPDVKRSRPMIRKWLENLIREISLEQQPPRSNQINPRKLREVEGPANPKGLRPQSSETRRPFYPANLDLNLWVSGVSHTVRPGAVATHSSAKSLEFQNIRSTSTGSGKKHREIFLCLVKSSSAVIRHVESAIGMS